MDQTTPPHPQQELPADVEARLLPDAPIVDLLSVSKNPILAKLSDAQLAEYTKRVRQLASPQSLSAHLSRESESIKSTRPKSAAAQKRAERQRLLDSL